MKGFGYGLLDGGKAVVGTTGKIGQCRSASRGQAEFGIGQLLFEEAARVALCQMAVDRAHRQRFVAGFREPGSDTGKAGARAVCPECFAALDRKSTRLNSSH